MGKFRDLTGQKFTRLTVLKRVENSHRNTIRYLCKCDCGNIKTVEAEALTKGKTKSCGCLGKENRFNTVHKDLTGQKFTKLTVLKYLGKSTWLCKCDCGNETKVSTYHLNSGTVKSCGCLRHIAHYIPFKHGVTGSPIYKRWQNMKNRCYYKKDKEYHNYGARGITVCEEWKDDFMSFYDWAITNGFSEELTLDRIDVNGNYEPSNCRWADLETQSTNRRNNRFIEINGVTKTITQWIKLSGTPENTVYGRLKKGWSVERALFEKSRRLK